MPDEASARGAADDERNIRIHLSPKATLRAVRVNGGFHILVGDDVEIRGVTPDHMRSLVGSVMDAYLPAEMASRFLNSFGNLARRRALRESAAGSAAGSTAEDPADGTDDTP